MMPTFTGGPAFPIEGGNVVPGMSLRDYFAAHAPDVPENFAFAGVIGQEVKIDRFGLRQVCPRYENEVEHLIRWRWHYADLMLAARGVA